MNSYFWMVLGLMWVAIAVGVIPLWRDRGKVWTRPADKAAFRTTAGLTIAAAIVGFILTVFAIGYSYGKARALADNLADEQARAGAEAAGATAGPVG